MQKFINVAAVVISIVLLYAFSSWNSVRKIDNFCNSINSATAMGELHSLAKKAGVDLYGPFDKSDAGGKFLQAVAPSSFVVGGYACSIRGDATTMKVTNKHLGR